MNYQTSSSSSPSTLPNSTPARTKTKTTTTTTFTLKNTTTTYPPFLRPAVPTNPRTPTTTTSPTPTTTSPTSTTTTTSSTSILPSQQTRGTHPSTPKRKPTVFDDEAYFLYWRDRCMRAMWDCFNTRRSEVPYGWGWEKMYERSGEGEEEREMVEWGGLERMAGVLEYNYHIFGNFSIMFGGRDAAGNVKVYFYHQRTAHPTLREIRILAYLWIRRTFTHPPTPSILTPTPSFTGPATPPASNTAHPYATRSRKRKRGRDGEISDDVTRLQGTSGGAEMGTGGLGRGGKLEGVAVVVMGEWLCMNR